MGLLEGQKVLITGASSGIGRACALSIAEQGAQVLITGRNEDRLKETLSMLHGNGHLMFCANVTDIADFEEKLEYCILQSGPLTGFIHAAGIETTRPLQTMSESVYHRVFSTNVIAAFEISRIICKKKNVNAGGAGLIFISSIRALKGQAGLTAYCSSKSALSGGCKAMALELSPKNIRVNCVLPAMIETEMSKKVFDSLPEESVSKIIGKHPLGLGKPEDVANACLFLLSDGARWITGTDLVVDGGFQLS